MSQAQKTSITQYFSELNDPRTGNNNILYWEFARDGGEAFGQAKRDFLDLCNGHDTLAVKVTRLRACPFIEGARHCRALFLAWIEFVKEQKMPDITIIDNEYVTMKYLEDKKTIYHVIHQPICGQPLRDMLSTGLNALKKYGVTKWMGDDRKNGPMSDEDRVWADANISNRVVESGWKYWALVVPEQIVAAGRMAPIIEANYERGLRMMVFDESEEAFAWLDQFNE